MSIRDLIEILAKMNPDHSVMVWDADASKLVPVVTVEAIEKDQVYLNTDAE